MGLKVGVFGEGAFGREGERGGGEERVLVGGAVSVLVITMGKCGISTARYTQLIRPGMDGCIRVRS